MYVLVIMQFPVQYVINFAGVSSEIPRTASASTISFSSKTVLQINSKLNAKNRMIAY